MWWTLLSACVVLGSVLESRRRLLAVRASSAVAAPFLHGPSATSCEPSERERRLHVAELNEATLEIGSGVARAGVVPNRCAKVALAFGALLALLEAAELVRGDASHSWLGPAISLSVACVGAFGCVLIGRRAEAEARRVRADWAALIRRSTRDVPTAPPGRGVMRGLRRDDRAPASGQRL